MSYFRLYSQVEEDGDNCEGGAGVREGGCAQQACVVISSAFVGPAEDQYLKLDL